MNIMKKVIRSLVLIATFSLAAIQSWAAFAGGTKLTATASAGFTGAGSVSISITIKNMSNQQVASPQTITWSGGVPATWRIASQYIQLDSTITADSGGIQIYTDNKAADASPIASTGICAGLVDTANTQLVLPLA